MIFDFSYVIDASRHAMENGQKFVGLSIVKKEESATRDNQDSMCSKNTGVVVKCGVSDAALQRSFTPGEIKKLIQDNLAILLQYYGKSFTQEKLQILYKNLDKLEEKADASGVERPLVLEEFDDKFQYKECVYGIVR